MEKHENKNQFIGYDCNLEFGLKVGFQAGKK